MDVLSSIWDGRMIFFLSCLAAKESNTSQEEHVYPSDVLLRITDGQVLGTHNSYHIQPETDAIELWNYTHPPLDEQLAMGVRQFEIDIVREPDSGEILVQHIPYIDDVSNCISLRECLETLRIWSDAHPWHFPLHILVEPKDETPTWSALQHFDEVDALILEIWGDRIWTPQDQQGSHSSLRESVRLDGWPTLDVLRGHAIFVLLDRGEARAIYTRDLSDLSARTMFPLVPSEDDFAAYFLRDNPYEEGLTQLVTEGFLVRSRGDVDLIFDLDRFTHAFSSGAHAVSVDTEESLSRLNAQHPVQCNPFAVQPCTAQDLE